MISGMIALVLLGCKSPEPNHPSPLWGIDASESWVFKGLQQPAMVVRTEANVPHIYATNQLDLARIQGFVVARDRFFSMDLASRLATGEVAALLGDLALESDQDSRSIGTTFVTEMLLETANRTELARMDAFALGVNDYIQAVADGKLPAPSELEVAAPLLGYSSVTEAMVPWDRRRVAGLGGIIYYNLGFETSDVSHAADYPRLDGLFAGAALGDLRQDGVYDDVWDRVDPPLGMVSAPSFQRRGAPDTDVLHVRHRPSGPHVPGTVLDRLRGRLDRVQRRLGRDHDRGWGSNAWAVMGSATSDGRALLAGDGHLGLDIPSLLYQIGLDTTELGGGDTHQMGMLMIGMPTLAVGTNGSVAWSSTQAFGDITDWYAEELRLDAQGLPSDSRFDGKWEPLQRVEEDYEVADIPLLGSVGRTETWSRWTTFDGRWITDIEGRTASGPDEPLASGEQLVNLGGNWVIPRDLDGDGVVTAVSFDFTGLDKGNLLSLFDEMGHAESVAEFNQAMAGAVALSQNMAAADVSGSVLFSHYQAIPCRGYLDRDGRGVFKDGADPRYLLDGTRYGGFTIPTEGGYIQPDDADPYRCAMSQQAVPFEINPAQGYVFTANNDPGGYSLDNNLYNDPWIGGPWEDDYRAYRIDALLAQATAEGWADIEGMSRIQNDHWSPLGWQLVPELLAAIDRGRGLRDDGGYDADSTEARMADLFDANQARFEEVEGRLADWRDAGFWAKSGVETFYDQPAAGDGEMAVATTLHNVWLGDFMRETFDDEGFPGGVWEPTGTTGRMRTMTRMLESRGKNRAQLSSYNPDTKESAFFDDLRTPEVETSDEIMLRALAIALDYLASDPIAPGEGGFGSDDMSSYLWGLRHRTKFESLLAGFIGDDPSFGFLGDMFSISTATLPLADGLTGSDPRSDIKWFPRHSDNVNIDTGKAGLNGRSFDQGSGAVFRLVIALGPDGPEAVNILPGGQSGILDSEYFSDQAELWLANEVLPMPITVDQVLEHAVSRESYTPKW